MSSEPTAFQNVIPAEPQSPFDTKNTPPPKASLWLWYLFFRPKVFFQHFVIDSMPLLTAICAWTYGMSTVIDRLAMKQMKGELSFDNLNWAGYLGMVVLGGVLGGLVYYTIGGWWYRVRLGWSGVAKPDRKLARRVYLYASQVAALPTLFQTFGEVLFYDSPHAAQQDTHVWLLAMLIFPFWAAWTSYRGVRTVFDARRGAALIWFFILPTLVIAVVLGGIMASAAAGVIGEFRKPPNLMQPANYHGQSFTFGYPGNWQLEGPPTEEDAPEQVSIESTQDAYFLAMGYAMPQSAPADEVSNAIQAIQEVSTQWEQIRPLSQWAQMRGSGVEAKLLLKGQPFRCLIFVSQRNIDEYIQIRWICRLDHEAIATPGLVLIEKSFRALR
ncbi:MAG: hypothetical protein IT443_03805 [Phycisphaeraceae bacterium]|nr:hypothetical protein [Phycisphaeraceae bacterium]